MSGIAEAHGATDPSSQSKEPALVPGAAPTDYTTGSLAAFGCMAALAARATKGGSYHVRARDVVEGFERLRPKLRFLSFGHLLVHTNDCPFVLCPHASPFGLCSAVRGAH